MTVTFFSGMTEATVQVPIINDNTQELTEEFSAVITTEDPNVSIDEDTAAITILDNDGELFIIKNCDNIVFFCSSKSRI